MKKKPIGKAFSTVYETALSTKTTTPHNNEPIVLKDDDGGSIGIGFGDGKKQLKDLLFIKPADYWQTKGGTTLTGASMQITYTGGNFQFGNGFNRLSVFSIYADTVNLGGHTKFTSDFSASYGDTSVPDVGWVNKNFWKSGGTTSLTANVNVTRLNKSFLSLSDVSAGLTFIGASGNAFISLVGTGIDIQNTITTDGIKYKADYAGLTDLSLIHRKYADSRYWKTSGSTTLTAGKVVTGENFELKTPDVDLVTIFSSSSIKFVNGSVLIGTSGDGGFDETKDKHLHFESDLRLKFGANIIAEQGLPTTDPLVAGKFWNNAGSVNISAG